MASLTLNIDYLTLGLPYPINIVSFELAETDDPAIKKWFIATS